MPKTTAFDLSYAHALKTIMNAKPEINKRTGKLVKAIHGLAFNTGYMRPASPAFPILSLRDIKPLWACAEAVWFLSGSDDPKWMAKFGFKVWDKFKDRHGKVKSATGWRWRQQFKVDQLEFAVHKLETDKTNRHAVLQAWDPDADVEKPGANVPCLVTWHLHCIGQELHLSVLQRSADMYFGFPHDILGARVVQELVAARLRMRVGSILYAISNAHLYEDQWPAAEEMMARAEGPRSYDESVQDLSLTLNDFNRAEMGDDTLPLELTALISEFYDPWPPITGPKIVL